jgi:isoaspartyl peptidase/L-asparaginase-like protein (Ntn-hydrolase superfamily)
METQGLPPNKAARAAVDYMFERTGGGCGGLIVVSKDGSVGYAHTSERMVWAAIEVDGKRYIKSPPDMSQTLLRQHSTPTT